MIDTMTKMFEVTIQKAKVGYYIQAWNTITKEMRVLEHRSGYDAQHGEGIRLRNEWERFLNGA